MHAYEIRVSETYAAVLSHLSCFSVELGFYGTYCTILTGLPPEIAVFASAASAERRAMAIAAA